MVTLLILILIFLFFPILLFKIFPKAGIESWKVFVPMLNYWEWNKLNEKPIWWFIFLLVPFINIFMVFLMIVETAKAFGKTHLVSRRSRYYFHTFTFLCLELTVRRSMLNKPIVLNTRSPLFANGLMRLSLLL